MSTVKNKYSNNKPRKRNYSFQNSKKLSLPKMTDINGIKIPAMPGSCYHAIMCCLAEHKNKFVLWNKIFELTEKYMRMYGGELSWNKFIKKDDVKTYEKRIKENVHTLTRTGRDCYGYRLHEMGMCIYFFQDGAMLLTGGDYKKTKGRYDVIFSDGRRIQRRYRGRTMTYAEYKRFVHAGVIDSSGSLINKNVMKMLRKTNDEVCPTIVPKGRVDVCIILKDTYNQNTSYRLQSLGFVAEEQFENELIGTIPMCNIDNLKSDIDVYDIETTF